MIGPQRPVPPPAPNPALDCYIKSGATPAHKRGRGPKPRPDCAWGRWAAVYPVTIVVGLVGLLVLSCVLARGAP